MTGRELYSHWWDMHYCETGAGEQGVMSDVWEDLSAGEQAAWNRLAKSIMNGIGCTIGWPLEPAIKRKTDA